MTVAVATIASDVFTALRALIIANKPTYTYNETVFTYTLVAEHSRTNPSFPEVVLNSSAIKLKLLNLDGSGEDYEVEVQLDFYAKELHEIAAVEAGTDGLRNTFIGNITEFNDTDGLVAQEDFWDDSNIDSFSEGNQVLNTASVIIKFKLR